jgi:hypothetical protein
MYAKGNPDSPPILRTNLASFMMLKAIIIVSNQKYAVV